MCSQRFECQFQLRCFYVFWLMLFREMNKEQFLHYFSKKDKNSEKAEEISVTKVVSSATKEVLSWGLLLTKSINHMVHQRSIRKRFPKKLKGKLEIMHWRLEIVSHQKLSVKYPKLTFIRTSVNNWKNKWKTRGDNFLFKKIAKKGIFWMIT